MRMIDNARQYMIFDHPFFSTVLLNMRAVETKDIPTMATDGKTLFYNETFAESLTLHECVGVLIHEVMHVVLMHHIRLRHLSDGFSVDPKAIAKKWNYATDYAINGELLDNNVGVVLPKGGLHDTKYAGYTAEQIYDMLPDDPSSGGGGGPQPNLFGDVMPAPGDLNAAEVDTTTIVMQAAAAAKMAGKMPGFMQSTVDALVAPRNNWRETLRRFVSSAKTSGYNWTRPNRRFTTSNVFLPSFGAKGIPALNCIVDTSGSVSQRAFRQFISEVNAATESYGIDDVITVMCDAQVQAVHHTSINDGDVIFGRAGHGGTDMNPAFEELAKYRPAPTILFSDMEFYIPVDPVDVPVLCCRWGTAAAPVWAQAVIDVTED